MEYKQKIRDFLSIRVDSPDIAREVAEAINKVSVSLSKYIQQMAMSINYRDNEIASLKRKVNSLGVIPAEAHTEKMTTKEADVVEAETVEAEKAEVIAKIKAATEPKETEVEEPKKDVKKKATSKKKLVTEIPV